MTHQKKHVFKKSVIIMMVTLLWALGFSLPGGYGQDLDVNNQRGFLRDMIAFKIFIRKAPNDVKSFGFDVHYDSRILEYTGYERGNMTKEFDFFDCVQGEPGEIRCGGFNKDAGVLSIGQRGEVVVLYFKKIDCRNTSLCLEGLVDDMENWTTGEGQFICLGR
ncbi:MAG: cohesin domain-containing protein [bacterium]